VEFNSSFLFIIVWNLAEKSNYLIILVNQLTILRIISLFCLIRSESIPSVPSYNLIDLIRATALFMLFLAFNSIRSAWS